MDFSPHWDLNLEPLITPAQPFTNGARPQGRKLDGFEFYEMEGLWIANTSPLDTLLNVGVLNETVMSCILTVNKLVRQLTSMNSRNLLESGGCVEMAVDHLP